MSDRTRTGDAPGSGRDGEWSRSQFWYNVAGAARITSDGEIREANPALARLLGADDPGELEGRNVMEFHPSPEEGPALIRKLRSGGAFTWEEIPLIHADGRTIWTLSNAQVVRRDDGSTEIFATVVDITERKRSERHRRRLAALVEQSRDAIIGKSLDGTIVSWNPAAERMYGWSAEEAIGRPATMLVPPDQEEEYEQLLARAARDEVIEGREVVRVRKDGSRFPISLTLSPIRDEEGQLIGISGIDRDMSVRKELEEHLEELAFEDPLTGLFNRRALAPQAQRALALADRHGESLAVLYVDLVGFKQINDRLGHAAGDEVLVRVARRLDETGRESDTVARVGGDEFVILLGEVDGEASARTASARFAERLREPVETGEGTVSVKARFGLALYPEHGRSFDELVSAADRAMGRLRGSRGTGGRASGEPEPSAGAAGPRLALANAHQLDEPLAGDLGEHLRLRYQPVFPAGGGSVRGLEALVRWREPGGELLHPDRFLELVETRGQLCDLDRWVTETVLEASAAVPWSHGGRPEWFSVNLSLTSLRDARFCDWLAERAEERPPDLPRLVVEVSEEAAVSDPAVVRERLSRLRERDVGVAIDDFGAGHSSLAELQRIPADRAKIALSLIRGVGEPAEPDRLARSVIQLAHALGLEVTVKGVERRRHREWLCSNGADFLQGYVLGRPGTLERGNEHEPVPAGA